METLTALLERTLILVLERGAVILPPVFLACVAAAVWIARRGGGWRPRGFWRWTGVVVCLLVAVLSSAAFAFQHRDHRAIEERAGAIRLELLAEGAVAGLAYEGRPTTLVLDRNGRIREMLIGRQSFENLERAIAPYL